MMSNKLELVKNMIVTANKEYGVKLIGDNFIGFKFMGDNKEMWNGLIENFYNEGLDISFLNQKWLEEQGLEFVGYNHEDWNR